MKRVQGFSITMLLGLMLSAGIAQTDRNPAAAGAPRQVNIKEIVDQLSRSGTGREVPTSPGNKEPQDLDPKAKALLAEGEALLYQKNQPDVGIVKIEAALKVDPRMPSAYTAVFVYYSLIKSNHPAAARLLEGGLQPCQKSSGVRFHLGNTYSAMQRYQDAVEQFTAALLLEPEYPASIHYNMGNAHEKLGRLSLAMTSWQRALVEDEKHLNARRNLVIAHYKNGSLDAARKEAKRLTELDPNGQIGLWAQDALRRM